MILVLCVQIRCKTQCRNNRNEHDDNESGHAGASYDKASHLTSCDFATVKYESLIVPLPSSVLTSQDTTSSPSPDRNDARPIRPPLESISDAIANAIASPFTALAKLGLESVKVATATPLDVVKTNLPGPLPASIAATMNSQIKFLTHGG
jgi:hypothetical protein